MIEKIMPCLGTFEVENKLWPFYADDFCFSIMSPAPTYDFWGSTVIKPENGFLYGKTYHENNIAVHLLDEIHTGDYLRFKTDSFVYSSSMVNGEQFRSFNRIVFVGGVLNKLSFNFLSYKSNDNLLETQIIDKFKYDIFLEKSKISDCKITVNLFSSKNGSYMVGSYKTTKIDNYLEIVLEDDQPLSNIFYHYEKIRNLMVFLTGYQDVYFDRINILHSSEDAWSSELYIEKNQKIDDIFFENSITFDCLGESVKELFSLLYNDKSNNCLPSLDFLPPHTELYKIDANYIRSICSAIEYELQVAKISSGERTKIKELIKEIKIVIEKNKKSETPLEEKTYSLIESSMSHWDMSLADKLEELRVIMDNEFYFIQDRLSDRNDISITEFVNCRNKITHKSGYEISETVRNTGLVFRSIIRCCVLKRIGVPEETIIELCKNRKV